MPKNCRIPTLPLKAHLLLLLIVFVISFGCGKDAGHVNKELSGFVDKVERDADKYKAEDWKKAEERIDSYQKFYDANVDKFSDEERKSMNENIGRYRAILIRKEAGEFKKNLEDATNQFKGMVDELTKDEDKEKAK